MKIIKKLTDIQDQNYSEEVEKYVTDFEEILEENPELSEYSGIIIIENNHELIKAVNYINRNYNIGISIDEPLKDIKDKDELFNEGYELDNYKEYMILIDNDNSLMLLISEDVE